MESRGHHGPGCGGSSDRQLTAVAPETISRRVLITGGSGFLGFRLASALSKEGMEVIILDIAPPAYRLPPGVCFAAGSVADAAAVDAAVAEAGARGSVDAVFHVASYGMSGRELRDHERIEAVNVGGTRNVVAACLRHGVPSLVYVSTCNVIFVGKPIHGGNESAPYPHPCAYKDHYSATKAQAERLVREADGLALQCRGKGAAGADVAGGGGANGHVNGGDGGDDGEHRGLQQQRPPPRRLHTCCIRSTGIWGSGETRHQPRVIRMVRAGLLQAAFGDPDSLSDWIHVDNLVQILILAERALRLPGCDSQSTDAPTPNPPAGDGSSSSGPPKPVAAGQVYYASDGAPINNFLHFKPMIVGLGYHYPSLTVPFALVYCIAALIEYAWPLLRYLVTDPPLTRMEVDKCSITHWFDIGKARKELGYRPEVYDRGEVVAQMAAEGWAAGAPRQRKEGAEKAPGGDVRRFQVLGVEMGMGAVLATAVMLVAVMLVAAYGAGGGDGRW